MSGLHLVAKLTMKPTACGADEGTEGKTYVRGTDLEQTHSQHELSHHGKTCDHDFRIRMIVLVSDTRPSLCAISTFFVGLVASLEISDAVQKVLTIRKMEKLFCMCAPM